MAPLPKRPPLCWGYARASLKKQDESPQRQLELLEQRWKRGDLPQLVARIEHASAIKKRWDERPEFVKILAEAIRGDFLLVWRLDRIDRLGFPLISAIDRLRVMGVRILSWEDQGGAELDLATAAGRAYVHVRAIATDIWSEGHRNVAIETHAWRKRHGLASGYYRIGLRREVVDGQRVDVWDKREIALIEEIVRRKDSGEPFVSIAADFQRRGETTVRGEPWSVKTGRDGIHRIMRAYHYAKFVEKQGAVLGTLEAKQIVLPANRYWAGFGEQVRLSPGTAPPKFQRLEPKRYIVQFGRIEQSVKGYVDRSGFLRWRLPNGFRGKTPPGRYRLAEQD